MVQSPKFKDTILIYKPAGEGTKIGSKDLDNCTDSDSLFALGIQSNRMLSQLRDGVHRMVCVDATHDTTQYEGFYLINFIVPDSFGRGYPAAWFIVNRMTREVLRPLFSHLLPENGGLKFYTVMTDDDPALRGALSDIFGTHFEFNMILCHWHLNRAWSTNLEKKVANLDLRNEVERHLRKLLEETQLNDFNNLLAEFLKLFTKLAPLFIEYFGTYYYRRVEEWSKAYRQTSHFNSHTNNYVESFHSVLKNIYLDRRRNRRIDGLIQTLFVFERQLHDNWETAVEQQRPQIWGKFNDQTAGRHQRAKKIPDVHVRAESANTWIVQSQSFPSKAYMVTRRQSSCRLSDHCFDRCTDTGCVDLCSHLYVCQCADRHLLCKHQHKVHMMYRKTVGIKIELSGTKHENQFPVASSDSVQISPPEKNYLKKINQISEIVQNLPEEGIETDRAYQQQLNASLNNVMDLLKARSLKVGFDLDHSKTTSIRKSDISPNTKLSAQWGKTKTKKKSAITLFQKNSQRSEKYSFTAPLTDRSRGYLTSTAKHLGAPIDLRLSVYQIKSLDPYIPERDVLHIQKEFRNFHPGWLYDEIIDGFLQIISNRAQEPSCMVVACWRAQMMQLPNGPPPEKYFIPINPSGMHWILLVINTVQLQFEVYDPMTSGNNAELRPCLIKWQAKCAEKGLLIRDEPIFPDHSIQQDSTSCGVYVCWFVERLIHKQLPRMENFNTLNYRKYMYDTIMNYA